MPRKRKTLSGDAAQNIKSVPGQRYGENINQQAMQRSMPAPQRQAPTPPRPVPLPEPTDRGVRPSPQPAQIFRGSDPIKRNTAQPIPSAVPLRTNRGQPQQTAPLESGVAELLNNVPKNVLRQPGSSANVPTAGISVGPGRGPNLGYMGTNMSPYKRTLMTLAMNTNNPVIRQLWESL